MTINDVPGFSWKAAKRINFNNIEMSLFLLQTHIHICQGMLKNLKLLKKWRKIIISLFIKQKPVCEMNIFGGSNSSEIFKETGGDWLFTQKTHFADC